MRQNSREWIARGISFPVALDLAIHTQAVREGRSASAIVCEGAELYLRLVVGATDKPEPVAAVGHEVSDGRQYTTAV